MAGNNYTSDIVDIGFVGNYYQSSDDTQRHAGVMRHAGDKDFYIFYNYEPEPTDNVINIADASFLIANTHTNIIGNVTANLVQSDGFLAAQGTTFNGIDGYSFSGSEGGNDTGMFSPADGQLEFYSNAQRILSANTGTGLTLEYGANLGDRNNGSVYFGGNFTQIGGGAAVAQLSNLQGAPLNPGSTVVGQTSGYSFLFSNYFDSRAAIGDTANSYPDIATVSNALVSDTGDYIVIDDYVTFYPSMNLTASVITV